MQPRGPMCWSRPPHGEACGGTRCPPSAPHPRLHPTKAPGPPCPLPGGPPKDMPPPPCPLRWGSSGRGAASPFAGAVLQGRLGGLTARKAGRSGGVTPPHPTLGVPELPPLHPEAQPAPGAAGARLGARTRFTGPEKGAPCVCPPHTHTLPRRCCTQGCRGKCGTKQGSRGVGACSVPP